MIGREASVWSIVEYAIFFYGDVWGYPDVINPAFRGGVWVVVIEGALCSVRRLLCDEVGVVEFPCIVDGLNRFIVGSCIEITRGECRSSFGYFGYFFH